MIKKIMCILIVCMIIVSLTGCGNQKKINNKTYDTFGLLNRQNKENPNIEYEIIIGNVVWSILLIETIIAPVYFLGFSIFEPVGEKITDDSLKGIIE